MSAYAKPIILKGGVKIYQGKSHGYDSFTVVHYVGGQRHRQTFAELDRARERAKEVERAILNGRTAVLELTNADRDRYVRASQLLQPFGIPLDTAVEEYIAARSHLDGESLLSAIKDHVGRRRKIIEKDIREIVGEFLAAKARDGHSERYIETLRGYLNRFSSAFQTRIGSVTAKLIDDWLGVQRVGPRTRNNVRRMLVTLFNFARARGYLPKGQATEAEDVAKARDCGGEIGILTPAEMGDLLKNGNQEAQLYFAIGGFAGVRAAEMIRLEWQDINFARAHIHVGEAKSKTATRRLVPIQPNLMQWLAPYRGKTGPVFFSEHAAIRSIDKAKQIIGHWPANALRHSYATYRLAQAHDAARVALELGNSPGVLFTNYRELSDEHDAKAWFSIAPQPAANVVLMGRATK
jgi:integrase